MKRILNVLFVCILAITLVGCGGNSSRHEGEAKTPSGSRIQKGRDYQEVIDDFEEKGFKNIKTELLEDLITGWLTKDGEVESVTVDGDEKYSADAWYPNDAEVVITYHTFPRKDEKAESIASSSTEQEDIKKDNPEDDKTETPKATEVPVITVTPEATEVPKTTETPKATEATETAAVLAEPLDLTAINNTSSAESDTQFVGKYYKVTGIIDQAMEPSDGLNAMLIIQPDVMAKGMGSAMPLEINIWLTADEFEKIGGTSSVGKQIDLTVKLTSISRNAISKDPAVKGYPIQLEFGEYN